MSSDIIHTSVSSHKVVKLSATKGSSSLSKIIEHIDTGALFDINCAMQPDGKRVVTLVFVQTSGADALVQRYTRTNDTGKPTLPLRQEVDDDIYNILHEPDIGNYIDPNFESKMEGHGLSRAVVIWKFQKSFLNPYEGPPPQPPSDHRLHIWKNGFSLDKENLQPFTKENTALFKGQICRGIAPPSLFHLPPNHPLSLELIPHNEPFVPTHSRIPGFSSTRERAFANLFGITDADKHALIRITHVAAPHIPTHIGLRVDFTGVIPAAQVIDRLRPAKDLTFEFVPDPCSGVPVAFHGPKERVSRVGEWRARIPPRPPHIPELSQKELAHIAKTVIGKEQERFWEKVGVVLEQTRAAREMSVEERRERSQGRAKEWYRPGEWVCDFCGQYCPGFKRRVCSREACGVGRFKRLEGIGDGAVEGGERVMDKGDEVYVEGNVMFLERPRDERVKMARMQKKLPLGQLFGLSGDGLSN